ncbi:reverse transcriptase domain-containing protein [Arthrobacter tumbae]|uniref:reverse transcriptase domain-containing protein n=1 Tax=Arthrobacter tumbae TaxID=163874 RepID=UPI0027DB4C4C|nr:reverse transcriptase domain-containing protein [Arthrobacter tumbae]
MDRLPLMITDRCLSESVRELVQFVDATYATGAHPYSETLTMPRASSGPRPVNIIAAQDRIIYHALVERLRPALPPETRSSENWSKFASVGVESRADAYIVEFDMASCYEYIDHVTLRRELILQSMDVEGVTAVMEFLQSIFGRFRGLPQLIRSSDLLSDVYLEGIERELLRGGSTPARYADDFKVVSENWGAANTIIETAADVARDYGLILSTGKTNIRKSVTVTEDRARFIDFLVKYFNAAKGDLSRVDVFSDNYGDPEEVESTADSKEAYTVAFRRILDEWYAAQVGHDSAVNIDFHARHIPLALSWLRDADERIGDDILDQIVFRAPLKLNSVLAYIRSRKEHLLNWDTILRLVSSERQSPWARLWLLSAAQEEFQSGDVLPQPLLDWAQLQLGDKHESVRAEAAWFLGSVGQLAANDLRLLISSATPLSLPALAATTATSFAKTGMAKAIKGESPLTRAAYAWGEKHSA